MRASATTWSITSSTVVRDRTRPLRAPQGARKCPRTRTGCCVERWRAPPYILLGARRPQPVLLLGEMRMDIF